MGLFTRSPQQKLERARELLRQGGFFDALSLFQELEGRGGLSDGERSEIRTSIRTCRQKMIDLRLQEAESLRLAGDPAGARDRCATAQDLAGADLETGAIEEMLRRVDAPRRPVTPTAELEDAVEDDLPAESEEQPAPTPVDRPRPEEPEPTDAELFGGDAETLFQLHLGTLEAETAEHFRKAGPDFRLAYLALVQGAGRRALDFFDRLEDWVVADPCVALERAHALLVAGRTEEALAEMDAIIIEESALEPETAQRLQGRRLYLRVEALRALGRYPEAVETAEELCSRTGESVAAESLLAWTLIEAGRAEEARERLEAGMKDVTHVPDELITPAAAAAGALGLLDEEEELLERLIQRRILHSASMEEEIDFPVGAGRRLLDLYMETEKEPEAVRGLLLHLIDHDPERGEEYREKLLELEAE